MEVQQLRKEINHMLLQVDGSGIIGEEALQFVRNAIEEKISKDDVGVAVKRKNYIDEVNERRNRMTDEMLGQFVRNTIWTVIEGGRR